MVIHRVVVRRVGVGIVPVDFKAVREAKERRESETS